MQVSKTIWNRIFLGVVFYTIAYLFIPAVYDLNCYNQSPFDQSSNSVSISKGHDAVLAQFFYHHLKVHKRQATHKHHHQVVKKDPAIKSYFQFYSWSTGSFPLVYWFDYAVSGCYTDIITPPPSIC